MRWRLWIRSIPKLPAHIEQHSDNYFVTTNLKQVFCILVSLLISAKISAQCLPVNPTTTISGLYTLDLNPPPTSIVYVAPNATITGNISLLNASIHNCGTILSRKISMKQSISNHDYILENRGLIKCDTLLLDSLGHIHNLSTIFCNQFYMNNNSSVDNLLTMEINRLEVNQSSEINSIGAVIRTNYFILSDFSTMFYNLNYARCFVRKIFSLDTNATVHGNYHICVDSSFVNYGNILTNSSPNSIPSTLHVNGVSENNGFIGGLDFCDISSSNNGMPDLNAGTLSNVTICSTSFQCDYSFTNVSENRISTKTIYTFPNPCADFLNITSDTQIHSPTEIVIFNTLGEIVLQLPFVNKVFLSEIPSGYYTLLIMSGATKHFSHFVKVD